MRQLWTSLVCAAIGFSSYTAFAGEETEAKDVYDLPKLVALQNRTYFINKSLTFNVGYLPIDAFNKGFIIGGSYSYYFTDFAAWEIVNANYSFNIETDIKHQLEGLRIGVTGQNTPWLDYVDWYATSNLVYTPLYNKSLLFNKSVVYSETSFVVGGGGAKFEFAGMRPIVGGGVMFQFFLNKTSSLKFDFRDYLYFNSTGANGILSLTVGYAMQLGDAPASRDSEPVNSHDNL